MGLQDVIQRLMLKAELMKRTFGMIRKVRGSNNALFAVALSCSMTLHSVSVNAKVDGDIKKISELSQSVAEYAVTQFEQPMMQGLEQLVSFKTFAQKEMTPLNNPEFVRFKQALKSLSDDLGLDYQDDGYVVLITLGEQERKLTIVTHGDVQPADPRLWKNDPFKLDLTSEPGRIVGRGTEDDKGAIITAMYAMKAIKDKGVTLGRGIELMVYMAEESDWAPIREYLKTYQTADYTITIDAEYPVVSAEKGWSKISANLPLFNVSLEEAELPQITAFSGGYFSSQVPQLASASLKNLSADSIAKLESAGKRHQGMNYRFEQENGFWQVTAEGKAAHSSTPEDGVNAVTHLAALLGTEAWAKTPSSMTVSFVNELVGLGIYAEQFGDIAYRDDFMGAMTLAPTVIKQTESGIGINLNLRRPRGKTPELLEQQALMALNGWQQAHRVALSDIETYWGEPLVVDSAPHMQTLLDVFEHYTHIKEPKPVAIGGSTNAKLFPNALSFGPAMPGVEYTGHTEHEFITHEQFMLNLKMYTAAFVELTSKGTR